MARGHVLRVVAVTAAGVLIPAGLAGTGLAGSAQAQQASARAAASAAAAAVHGTITTVAGGPGGPGPARSVSVYPCALKFAQGGLYFGSDAYGNPVVDRVSQSGGWLTPVAGSGAHANPSDGSVEGVPSSGVLLNGTCGVTVDRAGNVVLGGIDGVVVAAAKSGTFYGRSMTAGRAYTVASGFRGTLDDELVDVEVDAAGNLVVANAGSVATDTDAEIDSLVQVVAERSGTFYGRKMVKGKTYVIGGSAQGYTLGNGVPATQADLGYSIGTLQLDSAGNVVLAASGGGGGPQPSGPSVAPEVRVIASRAGTYYGRRMKAGYIYTIAGSGASQANGVPGTAAALEAASAVARDAAGNVLIAAGHLRVLAEHSGTFYGQKMTAGRIYTIAGPADIRAVAVDNAGNVLVDGPGYRVSMVAEKTGSYYGLKVRAGSLYTVAGNGGYRYSGDGRPATSAEINDIRGVIRDRSDNLIAVAGIADVPPRFYGVVRAAAGKTGVFFGRKMTAGHIYTIAAGLSIELTGVAAGQAGDVLVADATTHLIRLISNKTGAIHTIAGNGTAGHSGDGGPALRASLDGPAGVAADPAGNVFVLDNFLPGGDDWIREVAARSGTDFGQQMTAGDIYTIAGDGTWGNAGDGGPATSAALESQGIAADGAGNLVIASTDRIRVVAARSGTYYGQQMTAGHIYTVAGGGTQTGDGTPAASASIQAYSVTADSAGNLLVGNNGAPSWGRVWMVAEKAGAYYGKAMKAGAVYTIAAGAPTMLGDGGPATRAVFLVTGIAIGSADNLLISDGFTDRIRSVAR